MPGTVAFSSYRSEQVALSLTVRANKKDAPPFWVDCLCRMWYNIKNGGNMKSFLLLLILLFLSGCISKHDSSWHWRQIKKHDDYISNPKNFKNGFIAYKDMPEIFPSLYALVKKGEITHINLVFPNVPKSKKVIRFWMNYCNNNPDIIYGLATPSYLYYKTKGVQPFHMQLWFKPNSKEKIQKFIQQIEKFGHSKE
jgi:hypothetical protein